MQILSLIEIMLKNGKLSIFDRYRDKLKDMSTKSGDKFLTVEATKDSQRSLYHYALSEIEVVRVVYADEQED